MRANLVGVLVLFGVAAAADQPAGIRKRLQNGARSRKPVSKPTMDGSP
jgi:hypothetical protein